MPVTASATPPGDICSLFVSGYPNVNKMHHNGAFNEIRPGNSGASRVANCTGHFSGPDKAMQLIDLNIFFIRPV
jgi:hypothetical protein